MNKIKIKITVHTRKSKQTQKHAHSYTHFVDKQLEIFSIERAITDDGLRFLWFVLSYISYK